MEIEQAACSKIKEIHAPRTPQMYYGFTKGDNFETPAWFHSIEAAKIYAKACWGECPEIAKTTTPDYSCLMDTSDRKWNPEDYLID